LPVPGYRTILCPRAIKQECSACENAEFYQQIGDHEEAQKFQAFPRNVWYLFDLDVDVDWNTMRIYLAPKSIHSEIENVVKQSASLKITRDGYGKTTQYYVECAKIYAVCAANSPRPALEYPSVEEVRELAPPPILQVLENLDAEWSPPKPPTCWRCGATDHISGYYDCPEYWGE